MLVITLFSIVITVSVYILTRFLGKIYPSPLTSPVFLSTVIIIALLLVSNISYQEYTPAKNVMTYFLGPATVALALPIYKNRKLFTKYISAALIGLLAGTFMTIASAIFIANWLDFSKTILVSLSVKSVTVPVATEVGRIINGNIPLIAGFVMITGMIGAMFGPKLLDLAKVYHPFARGLAIGTIAHGIGTAEAVKEGEIQGAVSGAAMGMACILTSFVLPYVIPYFL